MRLRREPLLSLTVFLLSEVISNALVGKMANGTVASFIIVVNESQFFAQYRVAILVRHI